jgi:hypothetical protein
MNRTFSKLMKAFAWIAATLILILGGQLSAPVQRSSLQSEIQQLQQQGASVRFLDNATVEVSDPASGLKRVKTLQEPSEAAIRAWAAARGVPILEIDPRTLDTTRWSGWYRYWTTVPVGNNFGAPIVVGDLDRNGNAEIYGVYKSYTSDFESHIYEVDSVGNSTRLFTYFPRQGPSRQFTDIDDNSLKEIVFSLRGIEYGFQQQQPGGLPTEFHFRAARDSIYGSITTGVFFGSLDGDSLTDLVAACAGIDTVTGQPYRRVCVKEHRPTLHDFGEVWSSGFGHRLEGGEFGGFVADDFDRDGRQEFVACEIQGKVFVVENTGNSAYREAWRDSTPFVNLFYMTSGDIDRDNMPEFYLGATMNNGNWTTMYEADSNDHYSPRFVFHLLSGGSLDEPTYLTPDVDNDGRKELAILSGADLYVFKSVANDSFYLWYFKRFTSRQSIQFYDFNYDGKEDIILNLGRQDSLLRGHLYSEIFLANRLTGIESERADLPTTTAVLSYPNPFNSTTQIEFALKARDNVQLDVYDISGKLTKTVLRETRDAGRHAVQWDGITENALPAASGVYLCRLHVGREIRTLRLLLIR